MLIVMKSGIYDLVIFHFIWLLQQVVFDIIKRHNKNKDTEI